MIFIVNLFLGFSFILTLLIEHFHRLIEQLIYYEWKKNCKQGSSLIRTVWSRNRSSKLPDASREGNKIFVFTCVKPIAWLSWFTPEKKRAEHSMFIYSKSSQMNSKSCFDQIIMWWVSSPHVSSSIKHEQLNQKK